jgi:hypothetical protein
MPSSTFKAGLARANIFLRKYRSFVVLFLFLCAVAGSTKFLTGNLSVIGGPGTFTSQETTGDAPSLRTCSSAGTVFERIENLGDMRKLYRQYVSTVVAERETILRAPSTWKCGRDGEPESPMLESLAALLPGWHERVRVPLFIGSITMPVTRPVTFDSFSAILGEFQREYECKLTELQDKSIAEVSRNQDIDKPTQFCCTTDGCREQTNSAGCQTPLTDDPLCNNQCSVALDMSDFVTRLPLLHQDLLQERTTSRVAMERTLQTLRSFDMNFTVARQLICYERAALDLRQEMNLLADAVSCMPKIWDAITSLHN